MEQQARPAGADLWARRMTALVTRLMRGLSRRWLTVATLALGLFLGLPILAPVLMQAGYQRLGEAIHTLLSITCHQLPERSYFVFGPSLVYSRPELIALVGEGAPLRFVGNAAVGYKMAVCQRCLAIYGSWLGWGLLFGLVRRWLRPLPIRAVILLSAPIVLDGLGQLVGLWESTWITRTLTGVLFGLAVVWLTYPYIEQGMREMRAEAEGLLERGRQ